jgi:hypothetical protein
MPIYGWSERKDQGPTEEHLVEEIAGIRSPKRGLGLAKAAAHRRGLYYALSSHWHCKADPRRSEQRRRVLGRWIGLFAYA